MESIAIGENKKSANLLFPDKDTWLGTINPQIKKELKNQPKLKNVRVQVITLDQYVKKTGLQPDLIKIDTEGMDYSVLKSCEGVIKRFKPSILIEIAPEYLTRYGHSSNDVHRFLGKYGYHFFINLGPSPSDSDFFLMGRLHNLRQPMGLFNLLAIHPDSDRYLRQHRHTRQ